MHVEVVVEDGEQRSIAWRFDRNLFTIELEIEHRIFSVTGSVRLVPQRRKFGDSANCHMSRLVFGKTRQHCASGQA
jgi:hypothetical protein